MTRRIIPWNRHQILLYLGACVVFSLGAKSFIDSKLGVDPLDVLTIALSQNLHTTIGISSGMVAIGFLTAWTLWNRKFPPLTPFVTTFLVGNLIDLWILLDPLRSIRLFAPAGVLLVGGLLVCSYASSLIIMSGIGIRIMDLVAITMVREWRWSFFSAKMVLEVGLFTSGWLLGGPIGITTIAFLFLVGPFIQPFMWANAQFLRLPNYGLSERPSYSVS